MPEPRATKKLIFKTRRQKIKIDGHLQIFDWGQMKACFIECAK